MSVTVQESEFPALWRALNRLPAGKRRVSRLATLAHIGALFESHSSVTASAAAVNGSGALEDVVPEPGLRLTTSDLEDLGAW